MVRHFKVLKKADKGIVSYLFAIEWRGTITRDVGTDYARGLSAEDVRIDYESRFPSRRVVAVTKATEAEAEAIRSGGWNV